MYRLVQTTIWRDPKLRSLPRDGKFLFAYLLTNSSTHLCGIYSLPDRVVVKETLIAAEELATLWRLLEEAGLVLRDRETDEVWIVRYLAHQARGPKALRAAARHLRSVESERLIRGFMSRYQEVAEHLDKDLMDTLSDTLSHTLSDTLSDTVPDTPLQVTGVSGQSPTREVSSSNTSTSGYIGGRG